MKVEIYVQARMGSTRLPNKIMLPLLDGKPMLHYLVERLKKVDLSNGNVILTTKEPADNVVDDFCNREQIPCFRGSENDVLSRYYEAAKQRRPDVIVRITSDCPLLEPALVDEVIDFFCENYPNYDYVSTGHQTRTFPRGLDVEVFSFAALEKAYQLAKDPAEREHVTLFMYRHPELFKLHNIESTIDLSNYRLTVDTPEDFALIKKIYEALYPKNSSFKLIDTLSLLMEHPELRLINAHIEQKPV